MSDAMVELATCPVCLVVRVGERLLVCQAGHLLCCPCYNLLQPSPRRRRLCPLANCKFDSPPRRCLVAEGWVERTDASLPCRFVVEGCDMEVAREERREHEAACAYRVEGEAAVPVVEQRARPPRRRALGNRLDQEVVDLLTVISLTLAAISLAMFVVLAFNVLKVKQQSEDSMTTSKTLEPGALAGLDSAIELRCISQDGWSYRGEDGVMESMEGEEDNEDLVKKEMKNRIEDIGVNKNVDVKWDN